MRVSTKERFVIVARSTGLHFLIFLSLTTIALSEPLLQLYGENLTVFVAAGLEGYRVALFGLLVVLVPPLLLLFIECTLTILLPSRKLWIHNGLVGISMWLVVLRFLHDFPLGPWFLSFLWSAIVACGLCWAYTRWHIFRYWLRFMSVLGLAALTVFCVSAQGIIRVPSVVKTGVSVANERDYGDGIKSKDVSIALLVLDELPLFALLDPHGEINKERFPGFAELARMSTWYRNATATSASTIEAVPSILTGKFPKEDKDPTVSEYPRNLFTLFGGSMELKVNEIVTSLCPRNFCDQTKSKSANSQGKSLKDSLFQRMNLVVPFSFARDAAVVTAHKLLPRGLKRYLPPIDLSWGGFGGRNSNIAKGSTISGIHFLEKMDWRDREALVGPGWQLGDIQSFIDDISNTSNEALHVLHTLLPHRSWGLASDFRVFKPIGNNLGPKDRIEALDNYRDFLQQLMATDAAVLDLLKKLRESENWGRTMLIVTADHGITFEEGFFHRGVKYGIDKEGLGIVEDLYRVPFFIKYPNQMESKVNDCAVSHLDVLPTIAATKGVVTEWKFDGTNLEDNCAYQAKRKVLGVGEEGIISSSFSAAQKRADFYSTFVPYGGGVNGASSLTPYGALMGMNVSMSTAKESRVSRWSIDQIDQFQNVETGFLAQIPLGVSGSIAVREDLPDDAIGLMLIDGKVAGMIAGIGGQLAGKVVRFKSMLTASALDAGDHVAELAIVSGGALKPVITLVGLPS
jgi:hypothetical protein